MKMFMRISSLAAVLLLASLGSGCLHFNEYKSEYKRMAVPFTLAGLIPETANSHFVAEFVGFYPMPVSPVLSDEIEKILEKCEKEGVPILPPIKGENAPIFCMDYPSEEHVYSTLPPIPTGVPFVYEVQRKNVRITVEKLVDQIDECRFFPLVGPCQIHHCHFKCTVWWDETITSGWPIPFTHTDHKQEVLYIDKDHLHRCGDPGDLAPAGGPTPYTQY